MASEFEKILRDKLNIRAKDRPKATSGKPSGHQTFDWIFELRDFTRDSTATEKSEFLKHYNQKPKPARNPPPAPPPPKLRQKRKLTSEQIKALSVFHQYGEISIDDCSTPEEIRAAYRRLVKKFHPDMGVKSSEAFRKIWSAHKKLV